MIRDKETVAVVCHDAGGANVIIAWLKNTNFILRPYMEGPAKVLWETAFPNIAVYGSLEAAIGSASTVIAGTGWASDLEFEAVRYARDQGINSISVLDHWVNYESRFIRGGIEILPNTILVCDEFAYRYARLAFPGITIEKINNYYIDGLVAQVGSKRGNGILFVSEPIRETRHTEYLSEFTVLDFIKDNINVLKIEKKITIRPHPSDHPGKFLEYVKTNNEFELSDNFELSRDIAMCELVLGLESMALVVALEAGRRVISCLPGWAPNCRLPHNGILHLKALC